MQPTYQRLPPLEIMKKNVYTVMSCMEALHQLNHVSGYLETLVSGSEEKRRVISTCILHNTLHLAAASLMALELNKAGLCSLK